MRPALMTGITDVNTPWELETYHTLPHGFHHNVAGLWQSSRSKTTFRIFKSGGQRAMAMKLQLLTHYYILLGPQNATCYVFIIWKHVALTCRLSTFRTFVNHEKVDPDVLAATWWHAFHRYYRGLEIMVCLKNVSFETGDYFRRLNLIPFFRKSFLPVLLITPAWAKSLEI